MLRRLSKRFVLDCSIFEDLMETVTVNLGSRSYQILVGAGLLGELGSLLHHYRFTTPRLALVTDSIVSKIYREKVVGILEQAGFTPWVVEIPGREEHKKLAWLAFLYDKS